MSKKQSGTDNKNIILDGAFATLKKHGLPMISYDRIAEAAGLSRQVVRYHFPDQEDMMVALCAQRRSLRATQQWWSEWQQPFWSSAK